ncbi:unnamed protein product, partial [Vitis vinifera]|uniref:NAD(P)-binding domain-containing protein n=1 Tax=Vitis vinifera TaxID=29760 RepID=D7TNX8_VITVI
MHRAKQKTERLNYVEGVEHGLEFTIVRPFSWIGHKMDFIPTIDGLSEAILRVLPCFSNVSFNIYPNMYVQQYFFLFLITDLVSLSHICSLHLNMISFQIFNVVDNNSWTLDFFIMCEIFWKSIPSPNLNNDSEIN